MTFESPIMMPAACHRDSRSGSAARGSNFKFRATESPAYHCHESAPDSESDSDCGCGFFRPQGRRHSGLCSLPRPSASFTARTAGETGPAGARPAGSPGLW